MMDPTNTYYRGGVCFFGIVRLVDDNDTFGDNGKIAMIRSILVK
jgi:hypothetical protein